MGTIDYVAPEQARGERVDARADVYSLGCVLFTALTGGVPFDLDNDLAKLYAHDRSPAPSVLERNPDLPEAFETVLARALAKQPDERYQSAGDLGRAALAAAAGSPLPKTERLVAAGAAAPEDPEAAEATTVERDPPPPTRPATPAAESTVFEPATGRTGAAAQETELESPTIERDDAPAPSPAAATATAPGAKPRRRGLLVAAGVAAVGAVVAAIALAGGGDGGRRRGQGRQSRRRRRRGHVAGVNHDPGGERHREPVLRERPLQLGQLQHRSRARRGRRCARRQLRRAGVALRLGDRVRDRRHRPTASTPRRRAARTAPSRG